ncbi:hypothetical protein [Aeromicrobium sp. UC242_57]|uniref:hypothetical protein n=1 Tax=Aeromicrobium sp. UC242_57 TaxID=3374624 RepID=UPI0037A1326E
MNSAGSTAPELTTEDDFVPDVQTLEILAALAEGKNKEEAAICSHVSGRTMRRKLAELRVTWNVDSNVEAVVLAVRRGLI